MTAALGAGIGLALFLWLMTPRMTHGNCYRCREPVVRSHGRWVHALDGRRCRTDYADQSLMSSHEALPLS